MFANKILSAVEARKPILTFGAGGVQLTDGSTSTISGLSIGTASDQRYIVVVTRYRFAVETINLPTLTIGGQSCDLVVSDTATGRIKDAIWITSTALTTGTTANVVLTAPSGSTITSLFAATYSLVKYGAPILTGSEGSDSSAGSITVSSTLDTNTQVGVLSGIGVTTGTLTAISVSGAATQNYNSGVSESGALLAATLTGSGNVTISVTGTSASARAVFATWS